MRLRRRSQRACALAVTCGIPFVLALPIWIASALLPASPPPAVAWPSPWALLSALAPSSAPNTRPSASASTAPTNTAAPSAVVTTPSAAPSAAPSAVPRSVRRKPPLPTDIVDPWGSK